MGYKRVKHFFFSVDNETKQLINAEPEIKRYGTAPTTLQPKTTTTLTGHQPTKATTKTKRGTTDGNLLYRGNKKNPNKATTERIGTLYFIAVD